MRIQLLGFLSSFWIFLYCLVVNIGPAFCLSMYMMCFTYVVWICCIQHSSDPKC